MVTCANRARSYHDMATRITQNKIKPTYQNNLLGMKKGYERRQFRPMSAAFHWSKPIPNPTHISIHGSTSIEHRLSGFQYRASGIEYRVLSIGCRVSGIGCRLSGVGYRVSGIGYRVPSIVYRVTSIEKRHTTFTLLSRYHTAFTKHETKKQQKRIYNLHPWVPWCSA